jgi:FtsZ-binding cell division protein ZapB
MSMEGTLLLLVLAVAGLGTMVCALVDDEVRRERDAWQRRADKMRHERDAWQRRADKMRHERDSHHAALCDALRECRALRRQLGQSPKPYGGGGWGRKA